MLATNRISPYSMGGKAGCSRLIAVAAFLLLIASCA